VLGLAPIIAPIFGGYLLVVGSWRWIFWFQAAMSSLVLIAAVLRFDESRAAHVQAQSKGDGFWKAYRITLANPRVIGFTLAGAFNSGAFFSWISLAPYLLIEVYRISPQNFGWWFGANAAGFIGMSQVNAHLLRWRTPEEVLVRARLASVVSAVVLAIDAFTGLGGMLGVIIPLYVTLGSFGLVGPNTQAAAMNVDPTRTGTISSIVGGATFAVGALISSLAGLLHVGGARPLAALILFMILASSAALYGLAKPTATHHPA
jgi:DHA1 family bicyclomycin/chloramphenicol resistance-like MFS transporter